MIGLRLAQYNPDTGEFKNFLELGDFKYEELCIKIPHPQTSSNVGLIHSTVHEVYKPDLKDPLSRFNGRFDGRTYGGGKFVLIKSDQDDIVEWVIGNRRDRPISFVGDWKYEGDNSRNVHLPIKLGNIHENPVLWAKIQ